MSGSGEDQDTTLVSGSSGISSMSSHEPPLTATDTPVNGPKLRDTCRACASVKVRCSKEKPFCARCEARRIPCHYVRAKRPGRIPGSSAKRPNPYQGNDLEKNSASAKKGSRRVSELSLTASHTEFMQAATTSTAVLPGATQASITVNGDMTPGMFPCPLLTSTALALDNISGGRQDRTNSIVSNAVDTSYFAAAPGLDGDQSMQFDLDDFMNHSMDSTLEADLAAIDRWWLLEGGKSDAGADGGTGIHQPTVPTSLAASPSFASVGATNNNPLSSPSSEGVNLTELMDRSTTPTPPASVPVKDGLQSSRTRRGGPITNVTASPAVAPCDNCLVKALDLLKTLSKSDSQDTSSSPGASIVANMLRKNETDIETCLGILACSSCNYDRCLLMVCFMITMKILARYASAAALCGAQRASDSSSTNTTQLPVSTNQVQRRMSISHNVNILVKMSHALNGNSASLPNSYIKSAEQVSTREAIQPVLRELHQVQKLTSHLSLRLKSLEPLDSHSGSPTKLFDGLEAQGSGVLHTTSYGGSSDSIDAPTSPLSGRTFDLVEQDVRKSLSTLSAVIRGVLKNS